MASLPGLGSNPQHLSAEDLQLHSETLDHLKLTVFKENIKIQRQKHLMKNVIKNQNTADKKLYELEHKMREKEKKHLDALKQNSLERQLADQRKETKNK